MDFKKSKAPVNTVTRNIMDLCDDTHNIYESVAIIAKRANQISIEIKQELSKKLQEFASYNDSLEEVLRTANRLKSLATTRSCQSQLCSLQKSLLKIIFIGAILPRHLHQWFTRAKFNILELYDTA